MIRAREAEWWCRAGPSVLTDTTLPFSAGFIEALKGVIGMNRIFKAAVPALMLAVSFAGPTGQW
jgi:hypothetical protein